MAFLPQFVRPRSPLRDTSVAIARKARRACWHRLEKDGPRPLPKLLPCGGGQTVSVCPTTILIAPAASTSSHLRPLQVEGRRARVGFLERLPPPSLQARGPTLWSRSLLMQVLSLRTLDHDSGCFRCSFCLLISNTPRLPLTIPFLASLSAFRLASFSHPRNSNVVPSSPPSPPNPLWAARFFFCLEANHSVGISIGRTP